MCFFSSRSKSHSSHISTLCFPFTFSFRWNCSLQHSPFLSCCYIPYLSQDGRAASGSLRDGGIGGKRGICGVIYGILRGEIDRREEEGEKGTVYGPGLAIFLSRFSPYLPLYTLLLSALALQLPPSLSHLSTTGSSHHLNLSASCIILLPCFKALLIRNS